MIKDLIKEMFEYYVDAIKCNKSVIIKVCLVSIFLAGVTVYPIMKYLVPDFKEGMSNVGTYEASVGLLMLFILFIFAVLTLVVNITISYVMGYLKPVYFSIGLILLLVDMVYITIVGKVSVLMFLNVTLSYIILVLSIRDFVRFAFNRVILN